MAVRPCERKPLASCHWHDSICSRAEASRGRSRPPPSSRLDRSVRLPESSSPAPWHELSCPNREGRIRQRAGHDLLTASTYAGTLQCHAAWPMKWRSMHSRCRSCRAPAHRLAHASTPPSFPFVDRPVLAARAGRGAGLRAHPVRIRPARTSPGKSS